MKRGDIVTVALQGDYGKPRPAVVIESDMIPPSDSILVCPISSTLHESGPFRRQMIEASATTGRHASSQIMVDKVTAVRRSRCGRVIGVLDRTALRELTGKVAALIGVED
ncbi:MAG TPA: type II toxin-antitoxin system PemK/MazF family toxin [Acetobacteraceae bacterium]|nr:type II toxin-antitoxin system PemK/MazF family toxin [Acetobacteraceae bacterium]